MTLPHGLRIRRYESSDCEAIWELHLEGVRDARSQYPGFDSGEYEKDLRDIERTYLAPGCNFWVVESADGLIGMAAVQRVNDETGRLRRMRVTEEWRRRGVAQALLDAAEEFCRSQGYTRFILDTTEQQTAAHILYERAGFVRTGERQLGPFTVFDYEKALG